MSVRACENLFKRSNLTQTHKKKLLEYLRADQVSNTGRDDHM